MGLRDVVISAAEDGLTPAEAVERARHLATTDQALAWLAEALPVVVERWWPTTTPVPREAAVKPVKSPRVKPRAVSVRQAATRDWWQTMCHKDFNTGTTVKPFGECTRADLDAAVIARRRRADELHDEADDLVKITRLMVQRRVMRVGDLPIGVVEKVLPAPAVGA